MNMPQITVRQLNNLESRMKEKKLGKSNNNLPELIKWCEERIEIPIEPDLDFCGGIEYVNLKPNPDPNPKLQYF